MMKEKQRVMGLTEYLNANTFKEMPFSGVIAHFRYAQTCTKYFVEPTEINAKMTLFPLISRTRNQDQIANFKALTENDKQLSSLPSSLAKFNFRYAVRLHKKLDK